MFETSIPYFPVNLWGQMLRSPYDSGRTVKLFGNSLAIQLTEDPKVSGVCLILLTTYLTLHKLLATELEANLIISQWLLDASDVNCLVSFTSEIKKLKVKR